LANTDFKLEVLSDRSLFQLRVDLEAEMVRRGKDFSIGGIGEALVIEYFNKTAGLPTLLKAPPGTKNVDCLSRDGDRYSVKTLWKAKKTGTVYPDSVDKDKQLFEFLLMVRLNRRLELDSIHRFSWKSFLQVRRWDKRMSAWYLGCSGETIRLAESIFLQPAS
jgi:hypothetical protein